MLSLDGQAAVLRDADGQLRGHLSDRRTEEEKRGFIACGEKLHLVGYLWESARACSVCVCLHVSLFVQMVPPPLLLVTGTVA